MGKQSARIYFQGKDHKEIYYQGHYHKAMYIGSQLVWEKLTSERNELLHVGNIAYRNGLYIVYSFGYPKRGIFTGEDLENMHFIGDSGRDGNARYGKFMEEGYALIQFASYAGRYWETYLLVDDDLSAETYSHNNTQFPITVDVASAFGYKQPDLNIAGAVIIKNKVYFPNSLYDPLNYGYMQVWFPAGFNGRVYSEDVKDYVTDVFIKDGIVWGASDVVHGADRLLYIYQNFYSIDEQNNISKTEVRFPEEITEAIRLKVIQQACQNHPNVSLSKFVVYGDEKYGPYLTNVDYDETYSDRQGIMDWCTTGVQPYGYEYIINNKMYNYLTADIYYSVPDSTQENEYWHIKGWVKFAFYWKIDLETMEVIDFEISDEKPTREKLSIWGIPLKNTIATKYDTPDFTIYGIDDGTIIYNLTSEGDTVHKISVKDFEKDEYGIIDEKFVNNDYLKETMQTLCTSAYLKDGYIYLYSHKYKNDLGHIQLRINVETNTGDTVDVPKIYYTEEE